MEGHSTKYPISTPQNFSGHQKQQQQKNLRNFHDQEEPKETRGQNAMLFWLGI